MLGWSFVSVVAIALVGYLTLIAQRSSPLGRQLPLIIPAQAGLSSEVVGFRARGEVLTIAARHIPAPGAAQAVIIAYDSRECCDPEFAANALDLAAHLRRNGVTVLMLDLRDPSERGATRIAYGGRERRDLLGAVDWLLERGYAPGTVGVLGVSIGAIAGIGAANREQAIGALIVESGCSAVLPMMGVFAGPVLLPVLSTSQLTDIVSNKHDIFARWERMSGTPVRHEVSKPGGDEHGSPELLLITARSDATPVTEANRTWLDHTFVF